MIYEVGSASDRGLRRTRNEDAVVVRESQPSNESRVLLAAIADGMGGLSDGDLASRAAVAALESSFSKQRSIIPEEWLREAIVDAHRAVRATAKNSRTGTTLVAALVLGNLAHVANVGDSRAYRVGPTGIQQITLDHSVAAEGERHGTITPAEALESPYRHVLTRCLGSQVSSPIVDLFGPLALQSGERLLLCSDGLYSVVGDEEIADLACNGSHQIAVEELVRLANARGGPDNISVVVVGVA